MDAPGAGWPTWRAAAALAVAAWLALHVAARVADALWWRPRRLEAHFAAQGVRGPPYRFLLGSVREMVALMAEASSKPMSPATSHNALPRVLAFYHYWRKIYGACSSSFFHLSLSPMCRVAAGHVSPRRLIARSLIFLADFGSLPVRFPSRHPLSLLSSPLLSLSLSPAELLLPVPVRLRPGAQLLSLLVSTAQLLSLHLSICVVSLFLLPLLQQLCSCPPSARLAHLAAGFLHSMGLGLDHERSTWEKTCAVQVFSFSSFFSDG
jgi:hypothetical protein